MGLEATTTIAGLDNTFPLNSDGVSQGDDHLRLIKTVLKTIFPGTGGSGFATAITATEAELNYCSGVTSAIQTQIDGLDTRVTALEGALIAPSGTKLSFFQAAAPTGWTQDATNNDAALRVVSGAGGGTGGTDPFSAMTLPANTDGHAISISEMPAHDHGGGNHTHTYTRYSQFKECPNSSANTQAWRATSTQNTGASGSIITSEGGGSAHSHGITGTVTSKYIDVIVCSKD